MSKKPKTVKAWGLEKGDDLVMSDSGFVYLYSTRSAAMEQKHPSENVVPVEITIRILPTPGNKRSA